MIDDDRKLQELIRQISPRKYICMDTEADSLHAYPAKLCLIQISLPSGDFLVDPLSGLELKPLFKALKNKLLILHGADYDLRLLFQTFGFVPDKIFDTMIAARLLGFREFGLSRLTEQLLGIELDKGPQREDWARRPLTLRMEEYAKRDTRYLRQLAVKLNSSLKAKNRLNWLKEMCARLIEECAQPPVINPETCWRLKGHDKLNRMGLTVLRELFHWREEEALKVNKPPFFILPHETLVKISDLRARESSTAKMIQQLGPLLPRNFSPRRRRELIQAISDACAVPFEERPLKRLPRPAPLPEVDQSLFEELKNRRDSQAELWDIDPSLIASKASLMHLARKTTQPMAQLLDWQKEALNVKD